MGLVWAGTGLYLRSHTWRARAEARWRFAIGRCLGSVRKNLSANRSPGDLLRGESLDKHHGTAAVGTAPCSSWLCLVAGCGIRGWLRISPQQLLTEGQKLFPAPIGEKAGKADAHESARQDMQHEPPQEFFGGDGHLSLFAAVGIVLPPECERIRRWSHVNQDWCLAMKLLPHCRMISATSNGGRFIVFRACATACWYPDWRS